MELSAIMFYAISAFILGMAMLAVTSAKIFRSAIWLLLTLVGIAALYFWMHVEFIAAVQIVVYVGGIVVIIIFSIFLTQQSGTEMPRPAMKRSIAALLATLLGFAFAYNLVYHYDFKPAGTAFNAGVADVGRQMLSTTEHGYILPFEVVSILLLAAMIGCIVIAMKPAVEEKTPGIANDDNSGPGPAELSPIFPTPLITEEVT
jgi:NADH-quinone oxidoreductase subunit J